MKKILFASTALVATAGMAAAELTFGGYGRFGLYYQEGAAEETRIEQRFRLTVTGIAETDSGVKFEGRIRFQADESADNSINGAGPGSAGFAVSTGGFRVDVGNVSDVLDSGDTLNYYGYGVGLTSFLEHNNGFSNFIAGGFGASREESTNQQKVKLRYTAGDFTVSASYAPETTVAATPYVAAANFNEVFQIGAGYSFGNYNAGVVYGSDETADTDFWVIGFDGSVGDFSFAAIVGEGTVDADDTSWGLSGKYDVSAATSISAVVSGGGATGNEEAYGIGFAHSLGGGVTLKGGVGKDVAGVNKADLGVVFNF